MSKRSKALKLKGSTVLGRPTEPVSAASTELKGLESAPLDHPLLSTAHEGDSLCAVAAIPNKIESGLIATLTPIVNSEEVELELPIPFDPTNASTPWNYPATLLSIGHANMVCLTAFAQKYAAAKTPQEVVGITGDFYKEQGLLLKLHSEDIFKMFSL